MKKIAVAGLGYVGMSNALLFAKYHCVTAIDILPWKVEMLNNGEIPVKDRDAQRFMDGNRLRLRAAADEKEAFRDADIIIVAVPTDYDREDNGLNTVIVEETVSRALLYSPEAMVVIRSTVPTGFTEKISRRLKTDRIFFCPEFLREGHALHDSLCPSRIVIGWGKESDAGRRMAGEFVGILEESIDKKQVPVFYMNSTEAEAVKLFSNTYLALRIAFFNELDTFAELNKISTQKLIQGVCSDERIGNYYNNPSFGYGGYCLPKDSKQLLKQYRGIPQDIISAVTASNRTRKQHIAQMIIKRNPGTVGIYGLEMKKGSDNFRQSSILDVMQYLKDQEVPMVLFDPLVREGVFAGARVVTDLEEFKTLSDLIITNRWDDKLSAVKEKVYTRDIFGID